MPKGTISPRERKDPREAERQQERRHAINAERGKQVWVESSFEGTDLRDIDLDTLTDEQVLAIVPAHWERV